MSIVAVRGAQADLVSGVLRNLAHLDRLSGRYEEMLASVYSSFLGTGDVVVDVGAHRGVHTCRFLQLIGAAGKVIAVEPLSIARQHLGRLARYEPRIELHPVAVSDAGGTASFYVADDAPEESSLLVRKEFNQPTRVHEESVTVRTLDDIVPANDRVAFIKIDVEGAENLALHGAGRTLERSRPYVSVEHSNKSAVAADGESLYRFVTSLGYRVLDVCLNEYANEDAFRRMLDAGVIWDFVCVPEERFPEFAVGLGARLETVPEYRYPGGPAAGIDFAIPYLPQWVERMEGFSFPEPWGRWSDGGTVRIEFAEALPDEFTIVLEGYAFGRNAEAPITLAVGDTERHLRLGLGPATVHSIPMTNRGGGGRVLSIRIPHPAAPAEVTPGTSTDTRRLGIALVSLAVV